MKNMICALVIVLGLCGMCAAQEMIHVNGQVTVCRDITDTHLAERMLSVGDYVAWRKIVARDRCAVISETEYEASRESRVTPFGGRFYVKIRVPGKMEMYWVDLTDVPERAELLDRWRKSLTR